MTYRWASWVVLVAAALGLGCESGRSSHDAGRYIDDIYAPCIIDCFGGLRCVDGVVYEDPGVSWTEPHCGIGLPTCPRGGPVYTCRDGCVGSSRRSNDPTRYCREGAPKAVGAPCTTDADCAPADYIATPDGVITPNLECGPMSTCVEADERCNGLDENGDGVVDEGCAFTSNSLTLGVAEEVSALAMLPDGRFAVSTPGTIHFFDADAHDATLFEAEGISSLLETRDGFTAMRTNVDPLGAGAIDVLIFDAGGTLQHTWPIGNSFRDGRIVSADEVLRVVTATGLVVAFELTTGMRIGEVQLANMASGEALRAAFPSGSDALVLTTNESDCVAWVDADLHVSLGRSGCAHTMSDEPGTLYGFEATHLFAYAPGLIRSEVRQVPSETSSPVLVISRGDAPLLAFSHASEPAYFRLVHIETMSNELFSASMASVDERAIAGARDASSYAMLLWDPSAGARLLRVHAR